MSKPEEIQVLQHHQDLVQKLLSDINTTLGQSHFSFHVSSAQSIASQDGTEYHFKIKSNDGELYRTVIFEPSDNKSPVVRMATSLYRIIDILPQHYQRISGYTKYINSTYKVDNSKYQIVSVQQLIEEPNSYVFKVKGEQDGKQYKVNIQRPIVANVNKSPQFPIKSKISSS